MKRLHTVSCGALLCVFVPYASVTAQQGDSSMHKTGVAQFMQKDKTRESPGTVLCLRILELHSDWHNSMMKGQ